MAAPRRVLFTECCSLSGLAPVPSQQAAVLVDLDDDGSQELAVGTSGGDLAVFKHVLSNDEPWACASKGPPPPPPPRYHRRPPSCGAP